MGVSTKTPLAIEELSPQQLEIRRITEFILKELNVNILNVFDKTRKIENVRIRHSLFALFEHHYCSLPTSDSSYLSQQELAEVFGYDRGMIVVSRNTAHYSTEKNNGKFYMVYEKIKSIFPIARAKIILVEYKGFHIKMNTEHKATIHDYITTYPFVYLTISESKAFIDAVRFVQSKHELENSTSDNLPFGPTNN